MPKKKKSTVLRAVQAHQELGGNDRKFQELADHVRSSQEEYRLRWRCGEGDRRRDTSKDGKNENLLLVLKT